MMAYTIGLAYVLGYAVFKSGSVLLASYLHALNNQVLAFLILLVDILPGVLEGRPRREVMPAIEGIVPLEHDEVRRRPGQSCSLRQVRELEQGIALPFRPTLLHSAHEKLAGLPADIIEASEPASIGTSFFA